jgi:hypothetical protein
MTPKRCPKCNTSHGEEFVFGLLLAAALSSVIGLLLAPHVLGNPLGVPLIIMSAVVAALFSLGAGMIFGIYRAKRRGWL